MSASSILFDITKKLSDLGKIIEEKEKKEIRDSVAKTIEDLKRRGMVNEAKKEEVLLRDLTPKTKSMYVKKCSICRQFGHNSRTCSQDRTCQAIQADGVRCSHKIYSGKTCRISSHVNQFYEEEDDDDDDDVVEVPKPTKYVTLEDLLDDNDDIFIRVRKNSLAHLRTKYSK